LCRIKAQTSLTKSPVSEASLGGQEDPDAIDVPPPDTKKEVIFACFVGRLWRFSLDGEGESGAGLFLVGAFGCALLTPVAALGLVWLFLLDAISMVPYYQCGWVDVEHSGLTDSGVAGGKNGIVARCLVAIEIAR